MSAIDNRQISPRASTFLNRPQLSPLGPRTRWRTSAAPMDASGSAIMPRVTFGAMSPTTRVKPLPIPPKHTPPDSFSFPQSAASTVSSPPDPDGSGTKHFVPPGALAARPTSRPSSLLSEHSTQGKYSFVNKDESTSPTAAPAYQYNDDIETTPRPTALVSSPRVPQPPPKLTPPQPISFESFNVPWKGMPLEPALWTFNSTELQDIVSRAIRLSAKESFIRLLTIENLDKVLPAELERLDQLKTRTQARYRFLVQRRTMLFHALNSSVGPRKGEEGELLVSKLTAQLAETVMDCDQRLEELIRINDQISQVNKLLDVHASSALAVALRKLNTSYAHRTRDLNKARQRIFQLEAELEDAWKEAEKFANELDEYEASGADDAVIEKAEIVVVPKSPSRSPPPLTIVDRRGSLPMSMTPTLLEVKTISPLSPRVSSPLSHRSTSASLVEMKFVFPPPIPKDQPNDDAVSTRSVKSTKSFKGYASSLHAAKKRSSRASRSSLRLSIGSSHNHGRGPSEDAPPPIPAIPLHFTNAGHSTTTKNGVKPVNLSRNMSSHSSTTALYLYYAAGSRLAHDSNGSPPLRRVKKQASLDTLSVNKRRGSAAIDAYQGRAADDLYVESHGRLSALRSSKSPYSSNNAGVDLSWDDDSEIQAVPRTPPYRSRTISNPMDNRLSQHIQRGDMPPVPPPKDPRQTLPSAWKNVNAGKDRHSHPQMPLTPDSPLPSLPELGVLSQSVPSQTAAGPSAHKPGLLRRSKTLHKIKGFTKRYSASIPPIFNGKPSVRKGG